MEDNIFEDKLIKKIAQLKPTTPLTSEFVEHLSGQLRIKAVSLSVNKIKKGFGWSFFATMLAPIALIILVVVSQPWKVLLKQTTAPLAINNKIEEVNDDAFGKVDFVIREQPLAQTGSVNTGEAQGSGVTTYNIEGGVSSKEMVVPNERAIMPVDYGVNIPLIEAPVNNEEIPQVSPTQPSQPTYVPEQSGVAPINLPQVSEGSAGSALPIVTEQPQAKVTAPTVTNNVQQKAMPVTTKATPFVVEGDVVSLPTKATVYKVSSGLNSQAINNIKKIFNQTTETQVDGQTVITDSRSYGLVARLDINSGTMKLSKNIPMWTVDTKGERNNAEQKVTTITEQQALLTANNYLKSLGYNYQDVGQTVVSGVNGNFTVTYYAQLNGLLVYNVDGERKMVAQLMVDAKVNKVYGGEIYWRYYQASQYSVISKDEIKSQAENGGVNAVNQITGGVKLINQKQILLYNYKNDQFLLVPTIEFEASNGVKVLVPLVK